MSVNAGSVVIAIQAVDEASGVFGKIQASLGLLGNTLQGLGPGFQQVGSIISGFAAGGPMGAAIAGFGQLTQGLEWSIQEATKAQSAWTELEATLHLSGAAWDEAKAKIDSVVDSLRTTTTFSDTQLVGALQRMATYGMNASQAMEALKAATELAAAKNIDLETAATAIGKAFEGNTTILKRFGVEVQSNAAAQANLKVAFDEIGIAIKQAGGTQLKDFSDALAAVGINATDAHGKMLPIKDVMLELKNAFQSGAIDADKFAAIAATLGVKFEASKLGAADFAGVLDQVNKQYGGVAAANAQTYAGAQERLANAIQAMGEKIGAILLPALASLTEGMIPVVDWLTKGIVKVQDWIAAVAKMPEVKASTDALGAAWAGLTKYFEDTWNSVSKDLMPALQDLWNTLKDLWAALKPVFDAFGELMSAFGGSGHAINPLKILLEILVLNIKALAEFIRAIIPVVKLFAQGFKEAADIITPPLKLIVGAVGDFIKWLTDAFQSFYDWLVGHSLWQDLWAAVLNIASGVGATLKSILDSAFTLWEGVFNIGMTVIKDILTTGFDLAFSAVQVIVASGTAVIKSLFQGFIDLVSQGQQSWDALKNSVNTGTAQMKTTLGDFLSWLLDTWRDRFSAILDTTISKMDAINSKITSTAGSMQSTWSGALEGMVSSTQSALQRIYDDMRHQVDAIINYLQNAKNQISSHSIWPDMLNEMVDQTHRGMAAIQGEFSQGFESPAGILPTLQAGGEAATGAAPSATPTGSAPGGQAITLPINVYLDGQQIQTFLERRLIDTMRANSRSKRAFQT